MIFMIKNCVPEEIFKIFYENFSLYGVPFTCGMSPPSFICPQPVTKHWVPTPVILRQAHRPHASIVSERRLELNKCQVLILVLMRNVARMLDDFFDWNVLLISLFSVKIMIPCSESTETVEKFLRNLCTPNR